MNKYTIGVDMNTYTLADMDCFSTAYENISEAKRKNLMGICITKHGIGYKKNMTIAKPEIILSLPKYVSNMKVYKGIESTIMGLGRIDLDVQNDILKEADVTFVSYTPESLMGLKPNIEQMTKTYELIARNPYVMVLSHPYKYGVSANYRYLVPIYKKAGKAIEICDISLDDEETKKNVYKLIIICKDFNMPIFISSGAKICTEVGNFKNILELLGEIDYPEELIINTNVEKIDKYIYNYKKKNT